MISNMQEYQRQWYQLNKKKKKHYFQLNKEKRKQWYQLNREKISEYNKKYYQLNKEKVIGHYSNGSMSCGCSGCTENQIEFLTIDHSNNDGAQHRKEVSSGGTVYKWLIKNNFPTGFRVLCWNCNSGRRHGDCPHTKLIGTVTGVVS